VREQEVERRPAPVPERRRDDLSRRAGGDQAGDGLVLEQRLAVDVARQPDEQEDAEGRDACEGGDAGGERARAPSVYACPRPGRRSPMFLVGIVLGILIGIALVIWFVLSLIF